MRGYDLFLVLACIRITAGIGQDDHGQRLENHFSNNETWESAINTMMYHRSKMNEYLCRIYLVHEIMNSTPNQTLDKRLGMFAEEGKFDKESLLEDSGSSKYKDWLSRSTTLEDIYRHYEDLTASEDSVHQDLQSSASDGDVTGYALIGGKGGGHGDFGAGYPYHSYDHYEEEDEHEDKGIKLKELFDLALTGIAFLAFGTFIIEMMVGAFGSQNQEPQMMIMSPMPTVNGMSFKSDDARLPSDEQRSASPEGIPIDLLNELSRRVLSSIEALSLIENDGGDCLKRVLCENNKYSRSLSGIHKLWMPLWSFSTSWIAGRLLKTEDYSLLENLKAAVFGFADADCRKKYKHCASKKKK